MVWTEDCNFCFCHDTCRILPPCIASQQTNQATPLSFGGNRPPRMFVSGLQREQEMLVLSTTAAQTSHPRSMRQPTARNGLGKVIRFSISIIFEGGWRPVRSGGTALSYVKTGRRYREHLCMSSAWEFMPGNACQLPSAESPSNRRVQNLSYQGFGLRTRTQSVLELRHHSYFRKGARSRR